MEQNAFAKYIGEENYEMLADICTTYLKQTKDLGKLIKFAKIINESKKLGKTPKEMIYNYDWPEDLQIMVEQYKRMDQLKANIKARNLEENITN